MGLLPRIQGGLTIRRQGAGHDQGQPLAAAKFRWIELVDGTEGASKIRRTLMPPTLQKAR